MANNTQDPDDSKVRDWLAITITVVSLLGVLVLAAIIVLQKPGTAVQIQILSTVLPVIGTWVGTVLAFYFSKQNLEAATRSVTAMANQLSPDDKLRSKPVKS